MTLTLPENIREAMIRALTTRPADRYTLRQVCETTDPRTRWTPALQLIAERLHQALTQPNQRLIIAMPPQEGKSTLTSMNFPVWALMQNPELRIVTGSYAQALANRNGRAVRNHIKAHPEFGLEIARDNGAASEWTLEGHRGGLLAVGRGAGVVGRPADLLIVDDPLKDRKEADSRTVRQTVIDWWTDALANRLSPGASAIVMATRWHEHDLSGWLAEQGGWEVLNIPAQCEDPATDPLGRKLGQFLESAQGRTLDEWELRKAEAGPRAWASLFQGNPSPAEGDYFKREWWQHWDVLPLLDGTLVQSWDMTFTGSERSDYVVGQVWMKRGPDAYLLEQVRGQWSFTETVEQVRALARRWPQALTKLIEDKANGPAIIDTLRRELPGIVPVTPLGGKEARSAAVEPLLAAGNVYLPPLWHGWPGELIEEAAGFPNAAHDDQVDALTQALTFLFMQHQGRATTAAFRLG